MLTAHVYHNNIILHDMIIILIGQLHVMSREGDSCCTAVYIYRTDKSLTKALMVKYMYTSVRTIEVRDGGAKKYSNKSSRDV